MTLEPLIRKLPNCLTLLRLALCPFVVLCLKEREYILGLVLFLIASLTDLLDGYIARRWHAESRLGAFLDPLCDKVFLLSLFSLLMAWGSCPPWFLGLWISTNLIQATGYFLLRLTRDNNVEVRPSVAGKWNTALQLVLVAVFFLDFFLQSRFPRNFHFSAVFHVSCYVALAVAQVAVFFRYFFEFRAHWTLDSRLTQAAA